MVVVTPLEQNPEALILFLCSRELRSETGDLSSKVLDSLLKYVSLFPAASAHALGCFTIFRATEL